MFPVRWSSARGTGLPDPGDAVGDGRHDGRSRSPRACGPGDGSPAIPYVLMVLASTAIVWQDPIMNWAPYAVYNPQLWHFPEDWPLVRLSPTVEPFVVIGYSTFYFSRPFFAAHLDPAPPPGARVRRLVRVAPPARQPGGAALRHRVRHRRDPRDLLRPHRAVHLLAGDSVGLALRRHDLPVPADLGVRRSSPW